MFRMGKAEVEAVERVLTSHQLFRIDGKYQEVNTFENKLTLSVASLNDGIYFCSLMRDGQTMSTVKFLVKK